MGRVNRRGLIQTGMLLERVDWNLSTFSAAKNKHSKNRQETMAIAEKMVMNLPSFEIPEPLDQYIEVKGLAD